VGKKVRATLTIDGEVLKTAMDIGINESQLCENVPREAIQKLKSPPSATNGGKSLLGPASFSKEGGLVGRIGLEPATFCTSSISDLKGICKDNCSKRSSNNVKISFLITDHS
jgi:hypothetical protein